ncbi:PASTA domain-containing protein [Fibrobacter sp. UBA4309]|jgi:serine/threonine-protein kinase|uniref:PASTA domain-containing protein n=1 Tax=Fibrobacter sp. UBA4309 TaxID=1946537 RepID=UPI0025BA14DE|nr:PASTA domain-containing protein [Fibrobacter sp. UBA4309]
MNKLKNLLNKLLAWGKTSPVVKAACIWLVALVFFVFFVDKLLMPIFAGEFSSTGPVPNLEGMTQEAAESALTEAGFKFEWVEEGRYSSQVPAGMVLVQMPAAGRTAKLGRTVKLTKSLGLREVKIPDLRGKSQKQAEISLSRAGLVRGEIVKGAHQSIPRGVVIRTIPLAGKMARIGDTVKVVISAGVTTGKVLLPDFSGQVIDNVYPRLEKLGFKVGDIKRVKGENGEPPGTVLETAPRYGDYLPQDTEIDFVIAD